MWDWTLEHTYQTILEKMVLLCQAIVGNIRIMKWILIQLHHEMFCWGTHEWRATGRKSLTVIFILLTVPETEGTCGGTCRLLLTLIGWEFGSQTELNIYIYIHICCVVTRMWPVAFKGFLIKMRHSCHEASDQHVQLMSTRWRRFICKLQCCVLTSRVVPCT